MRFLIMMLGLGLALCNPQGTAPPPPPFTLDDLGTDLIANYDAALGVTTSSGGTVLDAIEDQVGDDTRKNLTAAGGTITYNSTGLNGRPTISAASAGRLEGSGAWTVAPSGAHTIYAVIKGTTSIMYDGNSGRNSLRPSGGSHWQIYGGAFLTSVSSVDCQQWHVVAAVFDPAGTDAIYVDDPVTPDVSGNAGTQVLDQLVLFDVAGGGLPGTGEMAQVLVVRGTDATVRANVMGFLASKFGL